MKPDKIKTLAIESIIYDNFPSDDDDFKKKVKSNYTMDELRADAVQRIVKYIEDLLEEHGKMKYDDGFVKALHWKTEQMLKGKK